MGHTKKILKKTCLISLQLHKNIVQKTNFNKNYNSQTEPIFCNSLKQKIEVKIINPRDHQVK